MDKHIYYAGSALILALLVLSFIGGRCSVAEKTVEKTINTTSVKIDTVEKEIRLKTTVINNKSDTTIIIDSGKVIQTKPFIARLDTICNDDTISARYAFPQDSFYLKVLPKPIMYKEFQTTVTKLEIVKIERPLWIDILSHSGSFLIGGLIGYGVGK